MSQYKEKPLIHGRGASSNVKHRFESQTKYFLTDELISPKTEIYFDQAKSIISHNNSPDIPFTQSINPYRGCEHGCSYCYARASHAYLELSPGLDFETKIFVKDNAPELLIQELSKSSYQCSTIALGNNTDAYQPVERKLKITRRIIEILERSKHPVSIVSKSSLILRDLDLLSSLASQQLAHVAITLTTLDHQLSSSMEPRATSPSKRLETIQKLTEQGIPVSALIAPIIPSVNDNEIEELIKQAKLHGAISTNYVVLRLPHEVKDVFFDWLQNCFPLRVNKIKNKLTSMFEGEVYNSEFGSRMRGSGEFADLINARFKLACKKYNLNNKFLELRADLFSPHLLNENQMNLF